MNTDSHLHLVVTELKGRPADGGNGATGEGDPHRASHLVHALSQARQGSETVSALCCGPYHLLYHRCAGNAAASHGVLRSFNGDIIVYDECAALLGVHFGPKREIHDIACVVLHYEEHAAAAVDCFGRGQHLVWRRRSKHVSRAGGIQHSAADKSDVQRLVAAATAGNQRHPRAGLRPLAAYEPELWIEDN